MTEVEVGLLAVLGHKDLAVLEGAHGARVNVEVRVGLLHHDLVAAGLEQAAERCRRNALAEGGYDAAGHKDVFCHVGLPSRSEAAVSTGLYSSARTLRT